MVRLKKHLLPILIFFLIAVASTVSLTHAQSIFRPNVTLPNGWSLADETPYPNSPGQHDTVGAGLLVYLSSLNNPDEVRIYYEKAPDIDFTDAALKAEAETLYDYHTHGSDMNVSGVEQAAGVNSGYAKYTSVASNFTIVVRVFIKDNYYFRVVEYYSVNYQSIQQVTSIVNSISINTSEVTTPTPSSAVNTSTPNGGTSLGDMTLPLIIGIALAVGLFILATLVLMRKRKKPQYKIKKK